MKMRNLLRKCKVKAASALRRVGVLPGPWDNTHQGAFEKHREEIFKGLVPERYSEIAGYVPGAKVLDVGSADGTLTVYLATSKKEVHGSEISKARFQTSLKLKKAWLQQGLISDNCTFYHRKVTDLEDLLSIVDCVVLIRVLYHLKEDADKLFSMIARKSNIKYVAVCGNASKEKKLERDEPISGLEDFAVLATEKGMIDFLESHGFMIKQQVRLKSTGDCLLVGERVLV